MAQSIIRVSGIYEIVNTVNGKRYIGSAGNYAKRWREHMSHLRRGSHPNRHLQSAWRKYGEVAFDSRLVIICAEADLLFYEQSTISALSPEYNLSPTAGSCRGIKMPPRTMAQRLKYRAGSLGNSNAKGKPKSEQAKRRLAIASTGNKNAVGAVRSAETRAKLSAARRGKGKPKSPSHRDNNAVVRGGLTMKQAEDIRSLYANGLRNQSAIARMYGLKPCSISRLISGETYRPIIQAE